MKKACAQVTIIAGLDGPSRTIVVEPVPVPKEQPAPQKEPAKEPEKAPKKEPVPTP